MIDFDEMISNHLKKNPWQKTIGRYYPSEVGGCLRKTWFSYVEPVEAEPELAKVFELGNIIHDFIVDVLRSEKNKNVELLEFEAPVKMIINDFTISGRIDDVILIREKNEKYLLEVKSTTKTSYVKGLNPQYKGQLMFYMHASGVHKGIILYVDKTNLSTKAFEVTYDKKDAERVIKRFKELNEALKKRIMPYAEAKQDENKKWMCKYCPYTDKCS
ncbi:MAG: PD-(D/E)XK nuclease family protein [archaeon]